ncbi:MAG: Uma2 family endonuclease [Magnetococcus sp. YQC-5]
MSGLQQTEIPCMTVEEFLQWESDTDIRHELINGHIIAMAPPSLVHGKILAKLTVAIQRQLPPPCYVIVEAGIRLADQANSFYQADLAVSCASFELEDRCLPEPVMIVEILSPSTQSHDRGNKVSAYRTLSSVREILLVSSTHVHMELWRRTPDGWLVMDLIGRDTRLVLESIGVELTLAEIYAGIDYMG